MDYIRFVDLENKKVYDLGKRSEAKYYLPFLAHQFQGRPVVLYGDETHCYLEDKYETEEYREYKECLLSCKDFGINNLNNNEMSMADFNKIFEEIGGKVVDNLEYHVQRKHKLATEL